MGVATKIPPHNLSEILIALKMLIQNPNVTVQELLSVLPGPDFPTGDDGFLSRVLFILSI